LFSLLEFSEFSSLPSSLLFSSFEPPNSDSFSCSLSFSPKFSLSDSVSLFSSAWLELSWFELSVSLSVSLSLFSLDSSLELSLLDSVADSSFEDSELDSADDSLDSVFSDVSGVLVSASVDELSLCSGVLASVSFSVSFS